MELMKFVDYIDYTVLEYKMNEEKNPYVHHQYLLAHSLELKVRKWIVEDSFE